jgi:hypothetical protein
MEVKVVRKKTEGSVLKQVAIGGGVGAVLTAVSVVAAKLWIRSRRRNAAATQHMLGVMEEIDHYEADEEDEEAAVDAIMADTPEAAIAAAVVDEAPQGEGVQAHAPAPAVRRRKPNRVQLGQVSVCGKALEVAQQLKMKMGNLTWTPYNRSAARRYIIKALDELPSMRTCDKLRLIPIIELYVFCKTDADLEMEAVIENMEVMGRLRSGAA